MYWYIARSGVIVVSEVEPTKDNFVRALYGEYSRWIRRALGKGKD